jgi:hypothetical protein
MSNARPDKAQEHLRGEMTSRYGIVSARLSDLADALETTPNVLMKALDELGIAPLVDTAKEKGRSREADERPTDPELRSLALPTRDLRKVAAALGAREALQDDAEGRKRRQAVVG